MSDFQQFASQVRKNVAKMTATGQLYETQVDPDLLWNAYLDAFPAGTNEIYRERRSHDCSCCRQFIRTIGNVVAIKPGAPLPMTIWDDIEGYPYSEVADALRQVVLGSRIKDTWYPAEGQIGVDHNFEDLGGGQVHRWDHFACRIIPTVSKDQIPTAIGNDRTTVAVVQRSFQEITTDAIEAVIDLIEGKALYRGEEHLKAVRDFATAHLGYHRSAYAGDQEMYIWPLCKQPKLAIRNTAIGTLLTDLSQGVPLEDAVRSFEAKVAPTNYRRTTAPITTGMVAKAVQTLKLLGLEDALERRHATARDVPLRDMLYVSRPVAEFRTGLDGLADVLKGDATSSPKQVKGAQKISVEEFLATKLVMAEKVEVLLEDRHCGNLVSMTAPGRACEPLFAWDNGFSWSYRGEVTDALKERVKAAGGAVDGVLRVSLGWENLDDLDLHVVAPDGTTTNFGTKNPNYYTPTGGYGVLDVDMNVFNPVKGAVENVTWSSILGGEYHVKVHNYTKRESQDVGFTLQIEGEGLRQTFQHPAAVPSRGYVKALSFTVTNGVVTNLVAGPGMVAGASVRELWGLKTGEFQEVELISMSPNFWGDKKVGNRHWFFFIKDCLNPDPVRGVYNEFLRPDLHEHRKVLELVGARTKVQPAPQQLSGLGFSSTLTNSVMVRVHGNNSVRTYEVHFND